MNVDPASTLCGSSQVDGSYSASPGQTDSSPSTSPQHHVSKRRREEDIEITTSLKSLLELHKNRDLKEIEKELKPQNSDVHYVLEIAETLLRFTPKQRAMAKAKMHQVLYEIEFPPEQLTPQPQIAPLFPPFSSPQIIPHPQISSHASPSSPHY